MARLVLTDSSPLIGLSRVDGIDWLHDLFGEVELTKEVHDELTAGDKVEAAIAKALETGRLRLRPSAGGGIEDAPPHLGLGEWSTLCTATSHDGRVLVLIEDLLARREASRRGLNVAGTAAVVGMAERKGLIPSARNVFEQLLDSDFRITPEVIRVVLGSLT